MKYVSWLFLGIECIIIGGWLIYNFMLALMFFFLLIEDLHSSLETSNSSLCMLFPLQILISTLLVLIQKLSVTSLDTKYFAILAWWCNLIFCIYISPIFQQYCLTLKYFNNVCLPPNETNSILIGILYCRKVSRVKYGLRDYFSLSCL